MEIERSLFYHIQKVLDSEPNTIILYGPRQAGKTTLIQQVLAKTPLPYVQFNGDDIRTQELLGRADLDKLKTVVGNNRLLVIDEAQRVENIGLTLKLLFDQLKIHIIASGSASFDLANKINEPMTGRSTTLNLFPFSYNELPVNPPMTSNSERMEEFLRFGMYPMTISLFMEEKENYLYDLINNYLYRDILSFEQVRKPKKVIDLLTLLALQIGSEVSTAELASHLSISKTIVEKYLDLMEKMFVIINLRGFSRNLRKEISKTSKYYFVDLGFRNALIRNFNPLNIRSDSGALFENYAVIERMKVYAHQRRHANFYFWRTYDQKEIDLIEESHGELRAYEFKWTEGRPNLKAAHEFTSAYKNSKFQIITPSNFDEFMAVPIEV
ncbi:MAG: ATP-binding protein [Nitrospirae bacterium]|nr:ATP-binding protein [Nitrospirota bacterium]